MTPSKNRLTYLLTYMYGTPLFDLVVALYTLLWQILRQTKTNSAMHSDWRASRMLSACFKFLSQPRK